MGTENRYKMSQARLDEIREELEYLQTVREKEVAEQIKEARSFGDLSENSEYDEAKTEQGKLYSKIAELQDLIDKAEIVELSTEEGRVGHGSHVRVRDLEDDSEEEYRMVGSQEANPMAGLISSDSPFGRGMMGHRVGEIVTVEAPAGELRFEILAVQN